MPAGLVEEPVGVGGAMGRQGREQAAAGGVVEALERHRRRRAGQGRRRPLAAAGEDQQHPRRARRVQDLAQQRQRVALGPLHVVDHDDQRVVRRQRAEELAQAAEGAGAELDRAVRFPDRQAGDGGDAAEDREDAGQRLDLGREQERDIDRVAAHEIADQGVDDAVDALERRGLALVATADDGDDAGARLGASDERAHERALADAGLALDEHRARRAVGDLIERDLERGELGLAAHERRRGRGHGRAGAGEPRDERGGGGAPPRLDREELRAELREIVRHVGERPHRRRVLALLAHEDLDRAPLEGQPAGEHLEEHDPDAVEIGRRADRGGHGLLGRHVRRRADHRRIARLPRERVAHEPEVEDDDPPRVRDHDVRGLEIAVDLAGAVQHLEALGELEQRGAQVGVVGLPVIDEVDALDQLHGEEPVAVDVVQLVEPHQVAVLEIGGGAELGLEPVERARVDEPQGLERDQRVALAIERLVHDAHPALTEHTLQLEAWRPVERDVGGRRAGRWLRRPGRGHRDQYREPDRARPS